VSEPFFTSPDEIVRVSAASYAVVKLTFDGIARYLLQRNRKRGTYNLVAGHVEQSLDEGYFERCMVREIQEELGLESSGVAFQHGLDFIVRPLMAQVLEDCRPSTAYPGLTKYVFKLFQLFFVQPPSRYSHLWAPETLNGWFTEEELLAGTDGAGRKVTEFPVRLIIHSLPGGLAALPESYPPPAGGETMAEGICQGVPKVQEDLALGR